MHISEKSSHVQPVTVEDRITAVLDCVEEQSAPAFPQSGLNRQAVSGIIEPLSIVMLHGSYLTKVAHQIRARNLI